MNMIALSSDNNTGNIEHIGGEYKFILAYGVVIMIVIFIMKFKAGYALIYYILVLALFLMLVLESKFIVNALAPIIKEG